jgi:hypothetical protein
MDVPPALRIAAIPAVVILVLVGLWIAGGLITNDFDTAMWLGAGWLVLAGVICAAVAFFVPALRLFVMGTYLIVAAIVGIYLARSVFTDDTVDEEVVTATASAPSQQAPGGKPVANVLVRSGQFEAVRHAARGRAEIIELAEGGRVLTLNGFEVDNGPDLRVYLVRGDAKTESEVEDYEDIGGLKGNKGTQEYEIPDRVDPREFSTVVIWCRAFSVLFARAPTRTG